MPSKKVLIIVENLPLPFDQRVWMPSNTLAKIGYEVSIFCPKGKGYLKSYEKINDINIYRHYLPEEHSSAVGYLLQYIIALFHELLLAIKVKRIHGFEIIQLCNPPYILIIVTIWFKWMFKTKVIFDHHNMSPELFESKFRGKALFYKALKFTEKLTFKTVDLVISTNESYKEIPQTRGNKDSNKIHVARSVPDLYLFSPVALKVAFKNGRRFLIGFLGVMAEFDGVDHLIKVANIIVNKYKRIDFQFCIIGSGSCFEELQELTKQYELTDFIEFTGRIPGEELISKLSSCDIFINPNPLNDE